MIEPQRIAASVTGTAAPPPLDGGHRAQFGDVDGVTPPCFALLAALRDGDTARAEPLDMRALAYAAARRLSRRDAIVSVAAAPLGDADGALYETGAGGWMLLHREGLDQAEARFVQAWLLGCYALYGSEGRAFECRLPELYQVADLDSPLARAYSFAARLLMPDRLCRDTLPRVVDAEDLIGFAARLGVPLWHAARRWVERTAQKAALLLDERGSVRACWLSETAYCAGLHLDTGTASARLAGRLAAGGCRSVGSEAGERTVPLSDWFDMRAPVPASPPLLHEMRVPVPALGDGSHGLTLLRLPRQARAVHRHAWRQYGG